MNGEDLIPDEMLAEYAAAADAMEPEGAETAETGNAPMAETSLIAVDGPIRESAETDQWESLAALKVANEVRTSRAEIRRDVRWQRRTVEDVLDEPSLQTMKVLELVESAGRGKYSRKNRDVARLVIGEAEISEWRTVGELTERQYLLLVQSLACHGYAERLTPEEVARREAGRKRQNAKSTEQRRQALKKANQIRRARARIKLEIRRREIPISTVLDMPELATLPVIELIKQLPFNTVGDQLKSHEANAARRILVQSDISRKTTVGKLTPVRRERLLDILSQYGFEPSSEDESS